MKAKKCRSLESASYMAFESPKKSVLKRLLRNLGYREDRNGRGFLDEVSFCFSGPKGGFARLFLHKGGWAVHIRRK